MCKIKKLYGTNVEREKNMGRYIIKRILWMIPILICVAILVFTMMYFVPGDTAQIVLGSSATPEQLEQYRELHGLNAPYISRLVSYLGSLLHGDFGTSYIYSTSVMSDLLTRFPRTFIIAIGTVIIGVVVGVPFGIWAAIKQDSIADRLILIISLVGASMPSFWLGLMLVILFALKLGWLPPFGIGGAQYYILPIIANGVGGFASNARLARSSMLEVIRSDYVTTARAKGVSERKVILNHASTSVSRKIFIKSNDADELDEENKILLPFWYDEFEKIPENMEAEQQLKRMLPDEYKVATLYQEHEKVDMRKKENEAGDFSYKEDEFESIKRWLCNDEN